MNTIRALLAIGIVVGVIACREGTLRNQADPAVDPGVKGEAKIDGPSEQAINEAAPEISHQDYSQLLARAQKAGSIRVIVRLNMPFVPEGSLSEQEAVDQRARISRMQDQLCAALSQYNAKNFKRFKYTPSMAMEVDSTALRVLISSPLVMSLKEDVPIPPAR